MKRPPYVNLVLGGILCLGLAACAVGCKHASPKQSPQKEKKEDEDAFSKSRVIRISEPATADKYLQTPKHEKAWTVHWVGAKLNLGSSGKDGERNGAGTFQNVTGSVYQNGTEASTFRSDEGYGENKTSHLHLTGHVIVVSTDQHATLFCDRLEWIPETKLIRASGNVRVEGKSGKLGTFSEVLATPKLERIGTPDLFDQP